MKCISRAYLALALVSINTLPLLYASDHEQKLVAGIRQLSLGWPTSDDEQKRRADEQKRLAAETHHRQLTEIGFQKPYAQVSHTTYDLPSRSSSTSSSSSTTSSSSDGQRFLTTEYAITEDLRKRLDAHGIPSEDMCKALGHHDSVHKMPSSYGDHFRNQVMASRSRPTDLADTLCGITQGCIDGVRSGICTKGRSFALAVLFPLLQHEMERDSIKNYTVMIPDSTSPGTTYHCICKKDPSLKSPFETHIESIYFLPLRRAAEIYHTGGLYGMLREHHLYYQETLCAVVLEGENQRVSKRAHVSYGTPNLWIIFPMQGAWGAIILFMTNHGETLKGCAFNKNCSSYSELSQQTIESLTDMILTSKFTPAFRSHYLLTK